MEVPGGPGGVGAITAGTGISISGTGVISAVTYNGGTAPPNPQIGQLWYDTSTTPGVMKVWDGSQWTPVGSGAAALAGLGLVTDISQALKVSITSSNLPPAPGTAAQQSVDGSMYWDNNLGVLFLRYRDTAGVAWVQTVPSGGGGGGSSFPAGTVMLFAQAAAPTGWEQITDAAFNDSAIRVVASAGGGAGGSIAFSTLFSPSSTYSGSINITSGSVGYTTLSAGEIASHAHSYRVNGLGLGGGGSNVAAAQQQCTGTGACGTENAGGNGAHTHSLVGAAAGGNFTSNFSVKYVNVIACSKQ